MSFFLLVFISHCKQIYIAVEEELYVQVLGKGMLTILYSVTPQPEPICHCWFVYDKVMIITVTCQHQPRAFGPPALTGVRPLPPHKLYFLWR